MSARGASLFFFCEDPRPAAWAVLFRPCRPRPQVQRKTLDLQTFDSQTSNVFQENPLRVLGGPVRLRSMKFDGPVYLNSCGMISALGHDVDAMEKTLGTAQRGTMRRRPDLLAERDVLAAEVVGKLPEIHLRQFGCRNNRMLLAALQQIQPDVDALLKRHDPARIGVVIGTSTTGIADGETALAHRLLQGSFPADYEHIHQEMGSSSSFLARYLGISGPAYTVSTACSSSGKVFASGRNLLRAGVCDAVLVGGVDTLCQLTIHGFSGLEAVSTDATNPMSANRSGITIGEGAALFILSGEPGPVELLGVGESSDAHHISAPEPNGAGAEASMRAALAEAGLEPAAVDYINMHGTGTPHNDSMESLAIERVFGCGIPASSSKSQFGHTLGASGGLEAGMCWLLCRDVTEACALPVHVWDGERDAELPEISLVHEGMSREPTDRFVCLSNSFAFGGSNCSVILAGGAATA